MQKCSIILLLAVLTSACAPTSVVKTNQLDIARMTPDCKNRDRQIRYLESQLTRSSTWQGDASVEQERSYNATVRSLIWQVREQCQKS
jgi:hypothetical protein